MDINQFEELLTIALKRKDVKLVETIIKSFLIKPTLEHFEICKQLGFPKDITVLVIPEIQNLYQTIFSLVSFDEAQMLFEYNVIKVPSHYIDSIVKNKELNRFTVSQLNLLMSACEFPLLPYSMRQINRHFKQNSFSPEFQEEGIVEYETYLYKEMYENVMRRIVMTNHGLPMHQ